MAGFGKRRLMTGGAILGAVLLMAFYSYEGSKKDTDEKLPPIPEQAIEKFNVTETEKGMPHWVLDASSAQILESEKKVLLSAPNIKFYENGQYVSTLVAAKGRINTDSYDMWGDGDCLLTTAKGETLETSNLHYRSDVKRVFTDEKVKLVRADETIYGVGLEATPDLETIIIKKQRVEIKSDSFKKKMKK
jgi:LPS export ABC transporter protein LptC